MSWIKVITYEKAQGGLKRLYDRIKGPNNYIDNILQVHSLRPHSLKGHMALYKNLLHHRENTLSKWLLEALGTYVSMLNACSYCVEHHFAGLKRLLNDDVKAAAMRNAFEQDEPGLYFEGKELALMQYACKLTTRAGDLREEDIRTLRDYGLDDGQILEANQVISYFNYANRTVLGLGVNTRGDVLGLSPGDDNEEKNWRHA